MKSIFVAAIIAAACSGVAMAGEVKQDQKTTQAIKATQMTDSDMDKVTAGAIPSDPGFGLFTDCEARGFECKTPPAGIPGFGRLTH